MLLGGRWTMRSGGLVIGGALQSVFWFLGCKLSWSPVLLDHLTNYRLELNVLQMTIS